MKKIVTVVITAMVVICVVFLSIYAYRRRSSSTLSGINGDISCTDSVKTEKIENSSKQIENKSPDDSIEEPIDFLEETKEQTGAIRPGADNSANIKSEAAPSANADRVDKSDGGGSKSSGTESIDDDKKDSQKTGDDSKSKLKNNSEDGMDVTEIDLERPAVENASKGNLTSTNKQEDPRIKPDNEGGKLLDQDEEYDDMHENKESYVKDGNIPQLDNDIELPIVEID